MGQKANSLILRSKQKHFESNFKYLNSNFEESTLLFYKSVELQSYVERIFNIYGIIIHTLKLEYSKEYIKLTLFICTTSSQFSKLKKKTLINNLLVERNNSFLELTNSHYLINLIIKNSLLEIVFKYIKTKSIKIDVKNIYQKFCVELNKSKKIRSKFKDIISSFRKFLKVPVLKYIFISVCISVFEKNSANFLARYISIYLKNFKKKHNYLILFLNKTFFKLLKSSFSKANGVKIQISGRLNGAPRAKTKKIQLGQIPLQTITSLVDYSSCTSYTVNGTFGVKVWICYRTKKMFNIYVFTT